MARLKAPERREQLLAVATKLFSERGYDATTTAAIAEAAGITEPVLYRHFENKKDLFIAVLRGCTHLLINRWKAAAPESLDATEQLRRIAASIYAGLPDIGNAQRVVYGAAATSCDPDVRAVLKEHVDQFGALAEHIIQRGVERGEFRSDFTIHTIAWGYVNLYTGFSFTRLHFPVENLDIRVSVELLLNGLCDGKRRTSAAAQHPK